MENQVFLCESTRTDLSTITSQHFVIHRKVDLEGDWAMGEGRLGVPALQASCVVCSEKATGFNYSAMTCHGCKTFFRRYVARGDPLHCPREGRCDVTKEKRSSCKSCRYNKCLSASMNPASVQIGRLKKPSYEDDEVIRMQTEPQTLERHLSLSSISIDGNYLDVIRRENRLVLMRQRSCWIPPQELRLYELMRRPCLLSNSLGKWTPSQNIHDLASMSERWRAWINSETVLVIEYIKSYLSELTHFSEDDQRAVIANCSGVLAAYSSAFSALQSRSDTTIFPDGMTARQVYMNQQMGALSCVYSVHCKPIEVMKELMPSVLEIGLLKAVAIFNPDIGVLSEEGRKIMRRERVKYVKMLQQSVFAQKGTQGAVRLQRLLFSLPSMMRFAQKAQDDIMAIAVCGTPIRPLILDLISDLTWTRGNIS